LQPVMFTWGEDFNAAFQSAKVTFVIIMPMRLN
jgi:hypothetical protein